MIKEFPVRWTVERLYCDECSEEMTRIKEKIKDCPPFEHECKYGHKATADYPYPALAYTTPD